MLKNPTSVNLHTFVKSSATKTHNTTQLALVEDEGRRRDDGDGNSVLVQRQHENPTISYRTTTSGITVRR